MSDPALLLYDLMQPGVPQWDRLPVEHYRKLFPAFSKSLHDCDCRTVDRIAMYVAQVGHECAGMGSFTEWADGSAYEGRKDLGNSQPGDGPRYRGRGAIMVTGRHNFTECSKWAHAKGLVPTATFFVDHPEELSSEKYCFVGATWYWVTQRPMNDASDARDLERATRYVNGGTTGLSDRRNRYNYALAMGGRLLELLVDPGKETVVASTTLGGEKVLKFNDQIVAQETYYNCGPASTQVALSCQGIWESESELARQLGTDTGGTDYIGQFPAVLNRYMPAAMYTHRDIPNDPPTAAQVQHFAEALKNSVDAGYALVGNIVAPPGNYPRGVKGSPTLGYKSGTYYHYVCFPGYDFNYPGGAVYWSDPGFGPHWSWVSLEQTVSLIAGKGFAYPTVKAPTTPGDDDVSLTPDQDRMLREVHEALYGLVDSTSQYAPANEGKIHRPKDLWRYDDGMLHNVFVEHRALLGEKASIDFVYAKMQEGGTWARHIWSLIPEEYKRNPIDSSNG